MNKKSDDKTGAQRIERSEILQNIDVKQYADAKKSSNCMPGALENIRDKPVQSGR